MIKIRTTIKVVLLHVLKLATLCRKWNISIGLLGQCLIKINDGLCSSLTISVARLYWYKVQVCLKYFVLSVLRHNNVREKVQNAFVLAFASACRYNGRRFKTVRVFYVSQPHTTCLHLLCDRLRQSLRVLNKFILVCLVINRLRSHQPASSRTCVCLEEISCLLLLTL